MALKYAQGLLGLIMLKNIDHPENFLILKINWRIKEINMYPRGLMGEVGGSLENILKDKLQ